MGVPHFGGGEFSDVVPRTHLQAGRSCGYGHSLSDRPETFRPPARHDWAGGELIAEMPHAPAGRSLDQKRFRRNVALLQPNQARNVRELISSSHAEPCKRPAHRKGATLLQGTMNREKRCSSGKQRPVRSGISLLSQMGAFGALGRCGRYLCWGLDLVPCGLVPEIAGLLEERRPPDTPFG